MENIKFISNKNYTPLTAKKFSLYLTKILIILIKWVGCSKMKEYQKCENLLQHSNPQNFKN